MAARLTSSTLHPAAKFSSRSATACVLSPASAPPRSRSWPAGHARCGCLPERVCRAGRIEMEPPIARKQARATNFRSLLELWDVRAIVDNVRQHKGRRGEGDPGLGSDIRYPHLACPWTGKYMCFTHIFRIPNRAGESTAAKMVFEALATRHVWPSQIFGCPLCTCAASGVFLGVRPRGSSTIQGYQAVGDVPKGLESRRVWLWAFRNCRRHSSLGW